MVKRLGKGLDALIPEFNEDEEVIQEIPLNQCRPNPYQPRKKFDEDSINELKDSILEYGIIQPLIVRNSIKGYEIVVGERRYRAASEAGLKTIPVVIKDLTDHRMMEFALLENLQREDLTPIEEAQAYDHLIDELKITQEELSKRLGKSRSHIANIVRLLTLPDKVVSYINDGKLSMGHGRALLGLKEKNNILPVVKEIREQTLNVRQVERLVQQINKNKLPKKQEKKEKDIFIKEIESSLREHFGTSVIIQRGKQKGKVEIEFYSNEDLERILKLINN